MFLKSECCYKSGGNMPLDNQDLVRHVSQRYVNYWTSGEIEEILKKIQATIFCDNLITVKGSSPLLYSCLCKYLEHNSTSGDSNCKAILSQEFPRPSKMILAYKDVLRGEKLVVLGTNKNICTVCLGNNCDCRSGGRRNINIIQPEQ